MRLLVKLYLVLSFVLFTLVSGANSLSHANYITQNDDFSIQYVLMENSELDEYVAISPKQNDEGFLPETYSPEGVNFTEKSTYINPSEDKVSKNIIALLFRTEIYPHAP